MVAHGRDAPGAGARGSRGRRIAKLPRAQWRRGEWHRAEIEQGREAPMVAKRKNEGRKAAMLLDEAAEGGMGAG